MKLGFPDDSQTEENIGTFPARLEGGARCGEVRGRYQHLESLTDAANQVTHGTVSVRNDDGNVVATAPRTAMVFR
jgi:hypothetical protein